MFTDVSAEYIASIFSVAEQAKQAESLYVMLFVWLTHQP
jgi:hypothetical protein